jgi:hypothetical protein
MRRGNPVPDPHQMDAGEIAGHEARQSLAMEALHGGVDKHTLLSAALPARADAA